eukprot:754649-Hanusia_phi.AAC.3
MGLPWQRSPGSSDSVSDESDQMEQRDAREQGRMEGAACCLNVEVTMRSAMIFLDVFWKSVGDTLLHQYIAEAYLEMDNLPLAHMHFACGNDPKRFGAVLRTLSSQCRAEEQDLIWARAILQSLCASNLELAVGLLDDSKQTVRADE